ncbi:hypothetical protein SLEP1_g3606 [Rubroshorea leprosula]|uniref:Reverse transcriptase domain-containing protein n=1 Tax=Rubroshorea leprosula TaxID=152421 RepID=A0AAV5HVA9_9ROSI|nr:hypothetical protein SLEP1_g3606 [Rubroshorea leprosula]
MPRYDSEKKEGGVKRKSSGMMAVAQNRSYVEVVKGTQEKEMVGDQSIQSMVIRSRNRCNDKEIKKHAGQDKHRRYRDSSRHDHQQTANRKMWKERGKGETWAGMEFNIKPEEYAWLEGSYVGIVHYMEMMTAKERFVWIRCQGSPMNVWGSEFFSTMGSSWGNFIFLDDSTSKKERFDTARFFISTSVMETIKVSREIKINESVFKLKFTEEEFTNCFFSLKHDFMPSFNSDSEDNETWSTGTKSEMQDEEDEKRKEEVQAGCSIEEDDDVIGRRRDEERRNVVQTNKKVRDSAEIIGDNLEKIQNSNAIERSRWTNGVATGQMVQASFSKIGDTKVEENNHKMKPSNQPVIRPTLQEESQRVMESTNVEVAQKETLKEISITSQNRDISRTGESAEEKGDEEEDAFWKGHESERSRIEEWIGNQLEEINPKNGRRKVRRCSSVYIQPRNSEATDGKVARDLVGDSEIHNCNRALKKQWQNQLAKEIWDLATQLGAVAENDNEVIQRIEEMQARYRSAKRIMVNQEVEVGGKVDWGPKPFRFFDAWLEQPGCKEVITSAWCDNEVEVPTTWQTGKGSNASFIVLIPKTKNPQAIEEFRPISLIGVTYKIIAKLLVNRLQKVLHKVIGEQQMAFIEGRQLVEGAVIANEIIDEVKRKKKKGFLFKVDFEKAYNKVCWEFIDYMMMRMGFCATWRKWIQECLKSSSVSILINGSSTNQFPVNKGIRQGDPLSPFLFLIVADGLNGLVESAVEKEKYKGVVIGSRDVMVSHLQFADDTIFFGDATEDNIWVIKCIMRTYELASGLKINFRKSQLIGVGVDQNWCAKMAYQLCSKEGKLPFSWDKVCKKKEEGGLGVRYLRKFNLALMGKWWGRLAENGEGMWKKIIVEKYGKGGGHWQDWIDENRGVRSTWWRDVCGINTMDGGSNGWLKEGFRVNIGEGNTISFWWDKWRGEECLANMFPRLYLLSTEKMKMCSEMGSRTNGLWEWNLTWRRNLFDWEKEEAMELHNTIQSVQTSQGCMDSWEWTHSKDGQYSTKSAYAILTKEEREATEITTFTRIWNSVLPNKISTFNWQLLLDRIPTKMNMLTRGIIKDIQDCKCGICGEEEEDTKHLFLKCNMVRWLWMACAKWWGIKVTLEADC